MLGAGKGSRGGGFAVAPITAVTLTAMFGQVVFLHDEAAPAELPELARWAVAVWIAGAVECVSLYIGWQAHDALLKKNFRAALRRRVASYAIALLVGGINYWHFSDGGDPTPLALIFGLCSALSPWLWGMHTRREAHLQLVADGVIDRNGAQFSSEKWLNFPIHTWKARRYSIMNNITSPVRAWDEYHADRAARCSQRRATGGGVVWWPLVRLRGVTTPRTGGAAHGASPGAPGGVVSAASPGVPGGVKRSGVKSSPGATAPANRTTKPPATPGRTVASVEDGPALQEAATRWAAAFAARGEEIPGRRPIMRKFPTLSEHRANKAAEAARERATGSAKLTVVGQPADTAPAQTAGAR